MEEDKEIPIILGRPFLRTTRVVADMRDEHIQFRFDRAVNCGWGEVDEGEAKHVNTLNNNDFRPNDNNPPQNPN
jgi:hypothetical protein